MLYAREIKIRTDKLIISSTEKRYLYDYLTLENLAKIVGPKEVFDIYQIDSDESYYLIEIHCERYETDDEQTARISRQQKYNENLSKFRSEKGRIADVKK